MMVVHGAAAPAGPAAPRSSEHEAVPATVQQAPEDAAALVNAPAGYWLGALESLVERADAFSQTGARVQWGWCRCACCPAAVRMAPGWPSSA